MSDTIRMLMALDGTGASAVSRCLAAMKDVVVLTRIHPLTLHEVNPLQQADQWYGLITDDDRNRLKSQHDWPFQDIMQMILDRASAAGKTLVIADRTQVDFISNKPVSELAGRFLHKEVLENFFDVHAAVLVRHPMDQWLELNARGGNEVFQENYLRGYHRFASSLAGLESVTHESFAEDPGVALSRLCNTLDIAYDPGWENAWSGVSNMALEANETLDSASPGSAAIKRAPQPETLTFFESSPVYSEALKMAGYASAS